MMRIRTCLLYTSYSKAAPFIGAHEVDFMKKQVMDARELLVSKTGAGNDFLGWIDLPVDYDKEEFDRIKKAAAKIQSDSEVLLVDVYKRQSVHKRNV